MSDNTTPQNLHVPQSKSGAGLTSKSVKDIMEAYKTQSKIRLYDDDSAQSTGAQSEHVGVVGKDIPLSMLRPSANPVQDIDENGNPIMRRPSRGRIMEEARSYGSIAKAYKSMNGIEEEDDDDDGGYTPRGVARPKDLSSVKRFEAEYIEDMPDTDEGLLEVLELAINNARANLEMLESLYAALSPSDGEGYEDIPDENY